MTGITAQRPHPGARLAALAAVCGLLAAGSVLGFAAPAQAHNYLVSSTPSAGETLTELPDAFSVTTNEALLDLGGEGAGFAMELVDADGLYYGDGCATVSGATLSVAPFIGAAGDYTVIWQVVSADGHTISDEYSFVWAPTDPSVATEGSTTPAACATADGGTSDNAEPQAEAPETTGTAGTPADADPGDVLWIGGAVVLVGLAVGVTLLVSGRKKKS
jgi:methionine-rich copper-binding protein CopC